MPVLTQKEYLRRKKEISKPGEGFLMPSLSPLANSILEKEIKEIQYEYYLLHPENGVDIKQNFQDTINLEGKEFKRNCINGVIRTKEKVLVTFLLKKGYLLIEKIKL